MSGREGTRAPGVDGRRGEPSLSVHSLTPRRWKDFEDLFGARGACGGCWCMWWRLTRAEFEAGKGDPNRVTMKAVVEGGSVPGLLAYDGAQPVGWCSVGPRSDFPRLARSRIFKPVDGKPVWSVVCFFVARSHRRKGVASYLLSAAVDYARKKGAPALEGYPTDDPDAALPDPFVYTGLTSLFVKAGFREAARRSNRRPLMRLEFPPGESG